MARRRRSRRWRRCRRTRRTVDPPPSESWPLLHSSSGHREVVPATSTSGSLGFGAVAAAFVLAGDRIPASGEVKWRADPKGVPHRPGGRPVGAAPAGVVRRGPIRERDQVSGGFLFRSDRRLPARADRANDIPGDRRSLRVWRSLGGALESARELLKLGTRGLSLPECRVDGVRHGRAGHTVGVGSLRGSA